MRGGTKKRGVGKVKEKQSSTGLERSQERSLFFEGLE